MKTGGSGSGVQDHIFLNEFNSDVCNGSTSGATSSHKKKSQSLQRVSFNFRARSIQSKRVRCQSSTYDYGITNLASQTFLVYSDIVL